MFLKFTMSLDSSSLYNVVFPMLPTKVTRIALENAASIAGMLRTTECVISEDPENEPAPQMPGGGMGGMM